MEEHKEILELLQKIDRSNRIQTRIGYIRCGLALVCAVFAIVMIGMLYPLLPQVNTILSQANNAMDQVNTVLTQSQTVLGNLEQTSRQLASVDLESMVSNVDTLVVSGQQSLEQSMEKLNSVDFEALNQAIQDLQKAIAPMAKLSQIFR